jgi:hypothetical protein
MSDAGRRECQDRRCEGVLDGQRRTDRKQRRRRHLEIENILADDDPDQRDQSGDHGTGGAARPESTNIRDASRLRGWRRWYSHDGTPMVAGTPAGDTAEP